eukprot:167550-Pyramimonas_sp.AAC.1
MKSLRAFLRKYTPLATSPAMENTAITMGTTRITLKPSSPPPPSPPPSAVGALGGLGSWTGGGVWVETTGAGE